jgi:carboxyl-terminal processing protease
MAPRTLCWLVLFAVSASLALRMQSLLKKADVDTLYREQAVYSQVRSIIKENYVTEIDEETQKKLFFGAMEGMASSLDKHTQFFPPIEKERMDIEISGQINGGIGIEMDDSKGLFVVTPILGTPAHQGGILPGDRILMINGQDSEKMKAEIARQLIKGDPGTTVTLTVLHEGSNLPEDITIKRAVIELPSITVAEFLDKPFVTEDALKIGYIKLEKFQTNSSMDLARELKKLEDQGLRGLVLDLRHNPGGLLMEAVKICDFFLKDGPIVSVIGNGRGGDISEQYTAKEAGTHPNYPITILIDSSSASAAEIVSGALKDRSRAVLVGDRTYGKFSVQNPLRVPLGPEWGEAMLKLTTARYKTPVGECKDGEGILPDHQIPLSQDQQRQLLASQYRRKMKSYDPRGIGPKPMEGEKPTDLNFVDPQLKKAAEVMQQMLNNPATVEPQPSAAK